ncbi:MAG: transcription elongation factor GreA, partial [Patescibacteria group bacterium]|nr:transcription elongation factor GreA [Patescibacteria group bacterium]
TKEKYAELERELTELKTARRREVAEQLEYAKSLGDLSENAEYQQAREEQARLEERITRLETILKHAVIIGDRQSSTIDVGSTVVIRKKGDTESRTFRIVGSEEANMAEGKLSDSSPIGAALIGKSKGERIRVSTPGGEAEYEVIEVK